MNQATLPLRSIQIAQLFLLVVILNVPSATLDAQDDAKAENTKKLLKVFQSEFIKITPGKGKFPKSFEMGGDADNQKPQRTVTFDYSFQVAKYEVPQNLWEAVMGSNPSRWKGKRNSVEMLSHAEAVEFCKKTTELMLKHGMIKKDMEIRLPSEAEWEYVARAGTKTVYSFGDNASQLGKYAWFTGNAAGNDPPVGAKAPNPWGLYDIHGYLWEWCNDAYQGTYEKAPSDGSAVLSKSAKRYVARSGSWKDKAEMLTCAFRQPLPAETRDSAVGLRCVLAKKK